MNPVKINLEDLQEIMDGVSEEAGGHDKTTLTRNDILIIARIVRAVGHQTCVLGFTSEEVTQVKRVIRTMNTSILAIGYAILAAIGAGIIAALGWAIKTGIAEIARKS